MAHLAENWPLWTKVFHGADGAIDSSAQVVRRTKAGRIRLSNGSLVTPCDDPPSLKRAGGPTWVRLTPARIATALRRLADDLEAHGDVDSTDDIAESVLDSADKVLAALLE